MMMICNYYMDECYTCEVECIPWAYLLRYYIIALYIYWIIILVFNSYIKPITITITTYKKKTRCVWFLNVASWGTRSNEQGKTKQQQQKEITKRGQNSYELLLSTFSLSPRENINIKSMRVSTPNNDLFAFLFFFLQIHGVRWRSISSTIRILSRTD